VWSRGFSSLGGVEGVSCCWSCFSGGLFLSVLCSVEANHGVFLFLMPWSLSSRCCVLVIHPVPVLKFLRRLLAFWILRVLKAAVCIDDMLSILIF
jgi:hypothetical protein